MKKYILLVIGMLMIANNALAETPKAFNEKGELMSPEFLTVAEAYSLAKAESATNDMVYLGYLKGILNSVLISYMEQGKTNNAREIFRCIYRPLQVYENVIFSGYETGKISGDLYMGEFVYYTAVSQCIRK